MDGGRPAPDDVRHPLGGPAGGSGQGYLFSHCLDELYQNPCCSCLSAPGTAREDRKPPGNDLPDSPLLLFAQSHPAGPAIVVQPAFDPVCVHGKRPVHLRDFTGDQNLVIVEGLCIIARRSSAPWVRQHPDLEEVFLFHEGQNRIDAVADVQCQEL